MSRIRLRYSTTRIEESRVKYFATRLQICQSSTLSHLLCELPQTGPRGKPDGSAFFRNRDGPIVFLSHLETWNFVNTEMKGLLERVFLHSHHHSAYRRILNQRRISQLLQLSTSERGCALSIDEWRLNHDSAGMPSGS
jgi:hypothetical protein